MKFFRPHFQIATLSPPQTRLQSKLGGLPWGFPASRWPTCCNHPQKLIAQLFHQPPYIDLGLADSVLHLLQCAHCGGCGGFQDPGLAAILLPRSELSESITSVPACDLPSPWGEGLTGEAFISHFTEHDDGIPPHRFPEFFDESKLRAIHDEYPQIPWFSDEEATRFGGSPRWTGNGPMGFPPPPFEFLFQLPQDIPMPGLPPHPDKVGCPVYTFPPPARPGTEGHMHHPAPGTVRPNAPWLICHEPGATHFRFQFANLASDGVLFVFINRTTAPPQVVWFYNR